MNEISKINNLWGDLPVEDVRTPHVVLREQASILTEATEGKLLGTVTKTKYKGVLDADVTDTFYAISKMLEEVLKEPGSRKRIEELFNKQKVLTPKILDKLDKSGQKQIEYAFTSNLKIVVPSFNNYEISIVQIDYPLEMYPLKIMNLVTDDYRFEKCETESELNQKLAAILSSAEVRRIVAGLLTEIRADEKEVSI